MYNGIRLGLALCTQLSIMTVKPFAVINAYNLNIATDISYMLLSLTKI